MNRIIDAFDALWFRVKFPVRKFLYCRRGKHKRFVMFITDGRTNVKCRYGCGTKLVPTTEELARHPHKRMTAEEIVTEKKTIDATLQWLDEHYRGSGR